MDEPLYALVVDDEPAVRLLTARALTQHGFTCDEAENGDQASELLGEREYAVLVTDLRMPRRNGHSLAVEVLGRGENRPLIVVLTGVLEPKLAADLVARGVDDIAFKPIDFNMFGAKVRALSERRKKASDDLGRQAVRTAETVRHLNVRSTIAPISIQQIEQRLDSLAGSLPVSPMAREIVNLIQRSSPSGEEVARALIGDPLLTLEVMRLANCLSDSKSTKPLDWLKDAVVHVGDRQIGGLVEASAPLSRLMEDSLPWLNWKAQYLRSAANGLIIQELHPSAQLGQDDEGLFLSAMLYPMSRILLAIGFPDLYQQMVAYCLEHDCSLASVESSVLPITPSRAMAGVLARWNISPRLFKPLQHAGHSYGELNTLTEPLRTKVERLRLADLLGQMAVGYFEPWDQMEFPTPETMRRLRNYDLTSIRENARHELESVDGGVDSLSLCCQAINATRPTSEVRYFKLGAEPHDFLADLLEGMGINTVRVSRDVACRPEPVLVNCLDASSERLSWFLDDAIAETGRPLICNSALPLHFEAWGAVVQMPCSFSTLAKAISAAQSKTDCLPPG